MSIKINFKPPNSNGGSPIKSFRVYYSLDISFEKKYLLSDTPIDNFTRDDITCLSVNFDDPQLAIPYYFKVAGVNSMGEGELSTPTNETCIDFPPVKPSLPFIKRKSNTSISISSQVEETPGSQINTYIIYLYKIHPENGIFFDEKEITVPVTDLRNANFFNHIIDELTPSTIYQLNIKALNKAGESPLSEFSQRIEIDALVPGIEQVSVNLLSPTSVLIEVSPFNNLKPKIIGFKVCWSLNENMTPVISWSSLQTANQCVIDCLEMSSSYFFSCLLVGEHEGYSNYH